MDSAYHQLSYANPLQTGTGLIFEDVLWTRMSNNLFTRQDVQVAGVATLPFAGTGHRKVYLFAKGANPSDLPGGRANHHGPVFRALGQG